MGFCYLNIIDLIRNLTMAKSPSIAQNYQDSSYTIFSGFYAIPLCYISNHCNTKINMLSHRKICKVTTTWPLILSLQLTAC